MAMTPQDRNEKAAKKKKAAGEKELRHKVRPGINEALNRVKTRSGTEVTSELIQIAIMKMDLMSDEDLIEFTTAPRHEIILSESVARRFDSESMQAIISNPDQDADDQIEAPKILPHGERECLAAQLDILAQQ